MKKKNSSRIQMITVSLLVWLTLGVSGFAQVPEVKPGDSIVFGRFASGGNSDTGTQKRTVPVIGNEVEISKADSRFNAQTRLVEANAEVYATLLSSGVVGSATAYIDTRFKLSGSVPRPVDVVISADAAWRGYLFTLASIGGGTAEASVSLQLIDDSLGAAIAYEEIFSLEGRANLSSFQDPLSAVFDRKTATIQATLVRGKTYTLRFQIKCEVKSQVVSVGMVSNFHSAAQGAIPASPRGAQILNMAMVVGPDLEELLLMLKDQLASSQSALTDLINGVNTNVTNSFNSLSQSVTTTNNNVLAVDNRLTSVQNTVNTIQGNTVTIVSQLNTAQTSLNTINNKSDTIINKSDTIINKVDTTNTNVNIVSAKVDDLAMKLMEFQRRAFRLEIEQALVEGDRYNVTSFQMPQSSGGNLEEVRSVVAEIIDMCAKSGMPSAAAIEQAKNALASGDIYFNAKGYKDAYDHYRAAYLHVATVTGNHRP